MERIFNPDESLADFLSLRHKYKREGNVEALKIVNARIKELEIEAKKGSIIRIM